MRSKRPVKTI